MHIKGRGKTFSLAQSFFIMNYYAKSGKSSSEKKRGQGEWGRGAEGELQNVPKLNCSYNTVQGCSAGFIRRSRAKLLPAFWDRRKFQFRGNKHFLYIYIRENKEFLNTMCS